MIKRIGIALVLALGLAACGTTQDAATPVEQPADLGVGHIHGLGLDPANGKTYVAGHYGLFTLESGKLIRVGDRDADHMGFTVAGPKTFYASGHPSSEDVNADAPHLGLIRSTDSGLTWEQVALAGKADFHALQVVGDTAYGYDSQTGQIWRGKGGEATTPEGVKVSVDGGKSFDVLKGAPLLSFVDVTGKDQLIGVAPDGQVQTSVDRGATWQGGGRLPMQAVAFTAVSAGHLLAAAMDGTIYESTDRGKSFTTVYQP